MMVEKNKQEKKKKNNLTKQKKVCNVSVHISKSTQQLYIKKRNCVQQTLLKSVQVVATVNSTL